MEFIDLYGHFVCRDSCIDDLIADLQSVISQVTFSDTSGFIGVNQREGHIVVEGEGAISSSETDRLVMSINAVLSRFNVPTRFVAERMRWEAITRLTDAASNCAAA